MRRNFLEAMLRDGISPAYAAMEYVHDWSTCTIEIKKDTAKHLFDTAMDNTQMAITKLKTGEDVRILNSNEISLEQVTLLTYAVNICFYVLTQGCQVFDYLGPIIQDDINEYSNFVESALRNLSSKIEKNFCDNTKKSYEKLVREVDVKDHLEIIVDPQRKGGGKHKEWIERAGDWEIYLANARKATNFTNDADLLMPIIQQWRSWLEPPKGYGSVICDHPN